MSVGISPEVCMSLRAAVKSCAMVCQQCKIKLGCETVGSRCFSRGYVFDDVEDFNYSEWSLEKFVMIVVSRRSVHDVLQKVMRR